MDGKFIAYYRVSTDRQGMNGNGMAAQRKAVEDYLNGGRWKLVGEFTEGRERQAGVSTTDQDLTVQIQALKAAGCDVIRKEKASGTTTKGRAELATILDFIREGDVLVVTRIDRLARSIADLQDIVRTLKARGAALRATEQPIDTSTAAGKCFLDMLGVFAEFETNLRRERQLEGIAKAKVAGVYKGRKPSIDLAKVEELKGLGLGPTEIARKLKIGRASVYRVVAQRADAQ
jgi:DNA invertase Pin-like site-specific DNA recombinase